METKRQKRRNQQSDDSPLKVARGFIHSVNRGSLDRLTELMTDDHVFIDSLGRKVHGRKAMRAAWEGYFRMVSNYRISAKQTLVSRNTVVILGTASGSYIASSNAAPVGEWLTPAAWRAVVRQGRLAEWQVYADHEPIRELMRRATDSKRV